MTLPTWPDAIMAEIMKLDSLALAEWTEALGTEVDVRGRAWPAAEAHDVILYREAAEHMAADLRTLAHRVRQRQRPPAGRLGSSLLRATEVVAHL